MLRGSKGLAGGGIYFAETPQATEHKALHKGVILRCEVKLGRVLKLGHRGDCSMTYTKLKKMGYDSVMISRAGGMEYVVYNHEQVYPREETSPQHTRTLFCHTNRHAAKCIMSSGKIVRDSMGL